MVQFVWRLEDRTRNGTFELDPDTEALAAELVTRGVTFSCELTVTGDVALYADRGEDLLDLKLVPNGPRLLLAVAELIRNAKANMEEP